MDYHKIQGFVYGRLVANTKFKDIHNDTSYKYFSFSNIFPPTPPKRGEFRNLLFASPDAEMMHEVFSVVHNIIKAKNDVNIGEQSYRVTSARLLLVTLKRSCTLRTATPITMRMSEKSYDRFGVPAELRKDGFLYWRKNLPVDIFAKLIEENIRKKFESFFNAKLQAETPLINGMTFLKEIVLHIPVQERPLKVPGSFWELHFDSMDQGRRRVVEFALDAGVGERTTFGLGFLNAVQGSSTSEAFRISA